MHSPTPALTAREAARDGGPAPPAAATVPRGVWRAAGLASGGRLFSALCNALTLVLLARSLPGDAFGRFTFYAALYLLFESAVDFGTSQAVIQRGVRGENALRRWISAGRRLRLATAAAAALGLAGTAWLWQDRDAPWIALMGLFAFGRVIEMSSVTYQVRIAWGVPVLVRAGASVLRLFGVALLLWIGVETHGPFLAVHAGGGAVGGTLLGWLGARSLGSKTGRPTSLRSLWRLALPLGLAGVCQQGYAYVDNLVLRFWHDDAVLGTYDAAVRVLSFLVMAGVFATTAALPWLARRHQRGQLEGAAERLVATPLVLAAVGLGTLWPLGGELLVGLFGPSFRAAEPAFRALLVAGLFIYAGAGWLTAVVARGRPRTVLAIAGSGLVWNLGWNLYWVPTWGPTGAAWVTATTELLVAVGALLALGTGVRVRLGLLGLGLALFTCTAALATWILVD